MGIDKIMICELVGWLDNKFSPKPPYMTGPFDFETVAAHFGQDIYTQMLFAAGSDAQVLHSLWAVKAHFCCRQVPHNLTPFQPQLLFKLHNSTDFIIFPTDKLLALASSNIQNTSKRCWNTSLMMTLHAISSPPVRPTVPSKTPMKRFVFNWQPPQMNHRQQ
jgi:hypothetical protein